MKFQLFSKSGKGKEELNEDHAYVEKHFGFVIDGASGYGNKKITESETDAKWYSATWKEYLMKHLNNHHKSLVQIMHEGLEDIIKKLSAYENYHLTNVPPSAAIAVFRESGDYIEYFVLADCSLLVSMHDGTTKIISKNDIREIDDQNMQLIIAKAKEQNISVLEAKKLPEIREVFVKMFMRRNTPQGGWVLSNSFEALKHAQTGTINKHEVKSILGLSDGYSQIYELFHYVTPEELANRIHRGTKLEELYEVLFHLQQKDELCFQFPRTKLRDDATAITWMA